MFPEADDYFFRTALIRYQRQSGLPVTGILDDETLLEMQQPRCNSDLINRSGRWKRFGQYRRADSKGG
ncbi:unnamed protein product [Enterobius vermicularis]|uniref:PG_binding_1 domain-containing protein n=1 Tax=Enterobius vermicularis TaxID=51028 RepID=A0A0N4UWA3_ENTVE|nr:unnamed protein product [Enterobius vermicularis]